MTAVNPAGLPDRVRLGWLRAIVVILAGPPVGTLVYLAVAVIAELPEVALAEIGQMAGLFLVVGWMIGLASSIAAVVLVQWLGLSRQSGRCLLEAAAMGAIAAIVTMPISLLMLFGTGMPPLHVLPLIALCGAVALCATALPGLDRRH